MSIAIYNAALVAHIIGITIMAGTAFIDFITFRAFDKVIRTDQDKGILMENFLYKLQRFLGIGMLIIILSGVTMMIKFHAIWGAQLWFRIKMGVLLLIIINGLGFRRAVGTKLRKILAEKPIASITAEKLDAIKSKFNIIQYLQMAFFVLIYVLSVYKFN